MRRRIMRPVVDLPQPDSPTRPSVSLGITSNETLSTARTAPFALPKSPFLIGKSFVSPRTDSSGFDGMGAVTRRPPSQPTAHADARAAPVRPRDGSATHVLPLSDRGVDARRDIAPRHMSSDRE